VIVEVAALALLVIAGCGHSATGSTADDDESKKEIGRVSARTGPAERVTIAATVYGLGRCEAPPNRSASLSATVEGKVLQILATPGAPVQRGQKIVQLDPTIAQAVLAEKTAARDESMAALRILESLPRPAEQAAARLAVEQARVAVSKAESTAERLRPLRARNEISEGQMYETELALTQAKLQQQTAEAQFTTLMLKPRPQAIEEGQAKIATAEAAVASAKAQVELLAICAPIDGILDSLNCRLGQTLAPGAPVGEVVDSRQIDVVVWLPVPDAGRVRVGQTAAIEVEGISGGLLATPARASPPPSGGEYGENPSRLKAEKSGRVTAIGRIADPQTGNLAVRIAVDNSANQLTVGQVAGATITVGEARDVLAVPSEAIYDLGDGVIVNVVRDGKSVVLHPKLGARDKHWVEILETDLKPGEAVVLEGGYNLPEGSEVTDVMEHAGDKGLPGN